jgi:serralysin
MILDHMNLAAGVIQRKLPQSKQRSPYIGKTIMVITGTDLKDIINGTDLRDVINALGGDDVVDGSFGSDSINGGNGNDVMSGSSGFDFLRGGSGTDKLFGDSDDDFVFGDSGNDTLFGGTGNDHLDGGTQDDKLNGEAGIDFLQGSSGADTLDGGSGADELRGDRDFDTMTGGADNDKFVFINGDFSSLNPQVGVDHRDIITDFTHGQDKMDFGFLDAKLGSDGDQAFSFIGTAKFTAEGQVRQITEGDHTVVQVNNSGADGADFEIQLKGLITLDGHDFIL